MEKDIKLDTTVSLIQVHVYFKRSIELGKETC